MPWRTATWAMPCGSRESWTRPSASFREALRAQAGPRRGAQQPGEYPPGAGAVARRPRSACGKPCGSGRTRPRSPSTWVCCSWKLERVEESIACNQRAVRLKPDHAEAHANLGNGLMERGQLDEAIAEYRVALQLRPDAAQVHSNLVRILSLSSRLRPARRSGKNAGAGTPGTPNRSRRRSGRIANLPDPERRLRVGYVSSEFRDHADAFFLVPLLSHHDHRRFEVFCYAQVARPDALTERLRGYADVWRDIVGALRRAGRRPGARRPDRHPRRPEAAHGRQPAPGLRPQAGAGAGHLAGISRNDRAVDHRLPPDRSLPRSAGALRRLLFGRIAAPAGHLLVLRPADRRAAGECASGAGIRRDHLRLPEQLLQGQRRMPGALGPGAPGRAGVAPLADGPPGPGAGQGPGQAAPGRDCRRHASSLPTSGRGRSI